MPVLFAFRLILIPLLMISQAYAVGLNVYAAGSLREAMAEMSDAFTKQTDVSVKMTFGPSGNLREEIEKGAAVDVFASASVEHTDTLVQSGKLKGSAEFAHNALCLIARPGIKLEDDKLVDLMLDTNYRLGTSTPKSDPMGDYTWKLFDKSENVRSGAAEKLKAKAQQLTGKGDGPAPRRPAYVALFEEDKVDLFVAYCTTAVSTVKALPKLSWMRFPDTINNRGTYGIGAAKSSGKEADEFVSFVLGKTGQAILKQHGFN
jgi:molybdate transport system substrate-binding protein